MPTPISPADIPPRPETTPNRIQWTRAQCEAIREAGVLTGRYELIDGEIISKMGQKPEHTYVIRMLMAWLVRVFGAEHVLIQSTVELAERYPEYDEPEPDAAVTTRPAAAYASRHPLPGDLLLVVEVSDATLRFDRSAKAAVYAAAGIREYWIIDIPGRQAYVHRGPAGRGYAQIAAFGAEERLSTLARPEESIRVGDLLPPA